MAIMLSLIMDMAMKPYMATSGKSKSKGRSAKKRGEVIGYVEVQENLPGRIVIMKYIRMDKN